MRDPNTHDIVAYTLIEDRKVLAYLEYSVSTLKAYLDTNSCLSSEERSKLFEHARGIDSIVDQARKDAGV